MAGGNWDTQNKVIPGAYINYSSVPTAIIQSGSRGVATIPLPMSWGPEGDVIEINATDLLDGKSEEKIGYVYTDSKSLPFRECLTYAAKLYAYRINSGGTKATIIIESTAPVGSLEITAKYSGVVGNDIAVVVSEPSTGIFEIQTLYRTKLKHTQTVATIDEIVNNNWVSFVGTGAIPLAVGTYLAGGTDGTVVDTNYTDYINKIQSYKWNTMGIPVKANTTLAPMFKQFIEDRRDAKGIKCQVVLYNYNIADYEGVISSNQGYKTVAETIDEELFICTVTGMTAGATYNESNTARIITGAIEIINPLTEEEIDAALREGKFVLGVNANSEISVIKDINTFTTFTTTKSYAFSKNLIIRVIDSLDVDLQKLWAGSYMGKQKNTDFGRALWKGNVAALINKVYVPQQAITEFKGSRDIVVAEGELPDSVVTQLTIKAVDVMEILYMNVYLR